MAKDHTFKDWAEAAKNAKALLEKGEIDMAEYKAILARAKKEQPGK